MSITEVVPPQLPPDESHGFVPDEAFYEMLGVSADFADQVAADPDDTLDQVDLERQQWYEGRASGVGGSYPEQLPKPDELGALLGREFPDDLSELDDKTVLEDSFIEITERLDPLGEVDPNHTLLDRCVEQAVRFRKMYESDKTEFPESYAADLYETELRYVQFGLAKLHELLTINRALGIHVRRVHKRMDFDRSEVLVADPPKGKGKDYRMLYNANTGKADPVAVAEEPVTQTQAEESGGELDEQEMLHIPRPGWAYLDTLINQKLRDEDIDFTTGPITDRPFHFNATQTVTEDPRGLEEWAAETFRRAGIAMTPGSGISSTDGEIAQKLPDYMRLRRAPNHLDEHGNSVRPTEEEQTALKAAQFAAIDNILDKEAVAANPDLEYHPKMGGTGRDGEGIARG